MKLFYNQENDTIYLYRGKSTIKGFRSYITKEIPFIEINDLHKDIFKNFFYIGEL